MAFIARKRRGSITDRVDPGKDAKSTEVVFTLKQVGEGPVLKEFEEEKEFDRRGSMMSNKPGSRYSNRKSTIVNDSIETSLRLRENEGGSIHGVVRDQNTNDS